MLNHRRAYGLLSGVAQDLCNAVFLHSNNRHWLVAHRLHPAAPATATCQRTAANSVSLFWPPVGTCGKQQHFLEADRWSLFDSCGQWWAGDVGWSV